MPNVLTGVLSGTSSIIRTQPLNVTENGTYNPPSGVDGYKPVTVNVPQHEPVIEQLTALYNGVYNAPSGVDGYDPVVVNVPTPAPVLDDITITENGHYTPPTGVDGYDDITVNVPLPANAYLKQTLSGLPAAVATFNGANAPLDSLKASIDATGWSSCKVNKWGFNWWDEQWEEGKYDTDTGEKTPVSTRIRSKGKIPMLPETDYYLDSPSNIIPLYYDAQGNYLKDISGSSLARDSIFTTPSGIAFMAWHSTTAYGNVYRNDICINLSKTTGSPKNGDYVAYNGNTYNIPFKDSSDNPLTVYNGTINITGGSWSGEDVNQDPITGTFTPVNIRSNGITNMSVNCGNITECKYFTQS